MRGKREKKEENRETCVLMGQFVKYIVFGTHVYEIWKTTFNVESYMCFMHFEPIVFFIPRLPLRVSRSVSACHVSMGWNWTGSKFQNQNLSFPQKHSSQRFFLPSLSFDTHSSHLSSLCHRGDLSFPQKHPRWRFFLSSLSFDTHSSHLSSLCHWGEVENRVEF